jgi:hypothetical protein
MFHVVDTLDKGKVEELAAELLSVFERDQSHTSAKRQENVILKTAEKRVGTVAGHAMHSATAAAAAATSVASSSKPPSASRG